MATFFGTVEEFMRFTGSYWRIKVNLITKNYKQRVGKCEDCSTSSKPLEAAHIRGKERPLLIRDILGNYVEEQSVIVDLEEFEDLFVAAHEPINSTIKILCRDCHRKYDRAKILPDNVQDADVEKYEIKEREAVVRLVDDLSMDKGKALQLIYQETKTQLNNDSTRFSNINSDKDVWRIELKTASLKNELNLILHHPDSKKLYHFRVPGNIFKNPSEIFYVRKDKPYSRIVVPKSNARFVDEFRGFDFTPFLVNEVSYL